MRKNNLKKDCFLIAKNISKKYYFFNSISDRLRFLFNINVKNIPSFLALNNISFELKKGDALAIVGENGSGKSSLLQIIAGISEPLKGKVTSHGRIAALLELGAGFNQEFTGRENIYLYGALYGLSNKEIDQKINDIIEFSGIHEFIDHELRLYSSGMLVRLAFSVIAFIDADILIIDEALAVGDIAFQQKCIDYLFEFKKTKILIFVSHDESIIKRLANKVFFLKKGKIISQGKPQEVIMKYHFEMLKTSRNEKLFSLSQEFIKTNYSKKISFRQKQVFKNIYLNLNANIVTDNSITLFGVNQEFIKDLPKISFSIFFKSNLNLVNCIGGFTIKNGIGQNIIEINNFAQPIKTVKVDEIYEFRFDFEMPKLRPGQYTIDIGIGNKMTNNHKIILWAYNAANFVVNHKENFNSMFYPNDVSFKHIKH